MGGQRSGQSGSRHQQDFAHARGFLRERRDIDLMRDQNLRSVLRRAREELNYPAALLSTGVWTCEKRIQVRHHLDPLKSEAGGVDAATPGAAEHLGGSHPLLCECLAHRPGLALSSRVQVALGMALPKREFGRVSDPGFSLGMPHQEYSARLLRQLPESSCGEAVPRD